MKTTVLFTATLLALGTATAPRGFADTADTTKPAAVTAETKVQPTPDQQVAALEAMCAKTAEARMARHAAKPLFERLGGEEKIHALTREVVRLHLQNEAIAYVFDGLDAEKVADRVAMFMIGATGGPNVYDGPDLTTSHADMKLTNADFMAAGADIIQAMKNMGYGQDEIDEMVCALVSMRSQVVLPKADSEKPAQH